MKTDLLKGINYSTINPFSKKEIIIPQPKTLVSIVNNDTTATKLVTKDSVIQPVALTLIDPVVPDTTAVAKNYINIDYKFHLVAGCFQIEENAVKFVQTLQAQNLNAAIIGQNNKGLFVVSCGDFPSRKDALNELDELRKVQPNAWLYKN
ncbi:MAG: SPOR domain-containing protein [Bacteroidetes bacterium]|nr:SPOR domain-containing protein [Bacteroidota bacterium]